MNLPLRLFLIGYRGSGKTTVAQQLALRLGYDWIDSDVEVELAAGKSIAAMFAEDGEQSFRDLEAATISRLCERKRLVVALGGGAVLREETRDRVAQAGTVVWLRASVDTLVTRIQGDPTTADRRPNLTNQGGRSEVEAILAEREPIYRAVASEVVDTEGKSPVQIAAEISARWEDAGN